MKNDFLLAIAQLAAEKNLPKDTVFEAVEAALTSAYRRDGENAPNIYVKIDPNHHLWSKSRIAQGQPNGSFKVVAESPDLIKPDPFPKGYQ